MILPRFYVSGLSLFGELVPETHPQWRRGTFELLEMIHIPIPIFMPPPGFRYKNRQNGTDDRNSSQEESNREANWAKPHEMIPLPTYQWRSYNQYP